ncbi:hypothetical protein BDW66DRAFT_30400 [Aspergillus desertorum]
MKLESKWTAKFIHGYRSLSKDNVRIDTLKRFVKCVKIADVYALAETDRSLSLIRISAPAGLWILEVFLQVLFPGIA